MKDKELKPCPFCGGEAKLTYNYTVASHVGCKRGVHCGKCGCNLFVFGTEAVAITAWNTRPSPWIEIKSEDDLPKDGTICFFINGMCRYSGTYRSNNKSFCSVHSDHPWKSVHHYMPIPELPKKG